MQESMSVCVRACVCMACACVCACVHLMPYVHYQLYLFIDYMGNSYFLNLIFVQL